MVRRFIAGESLEEVLPALETLRDGGYLTTVDVLGESVDSADACGAAAGRYEETLDALAARGLERNVSLKLTQMGLDIDRDLCRDTVATVFRKAAEHGAFVRIDMEDHTKTDATLDLWRELRPVNPNSGVVIQAALRRSSGDIETLIVEGARVRLCKGAYNEPPSIALRDRDEIDAAYEKQARRLMADGSLPGPRHPRRPAHRPPHPLGRGRGDRPRPLRVPDAPWDPPRPPGAAARARASGSASTSPTARSGTRTSCAASPRGRPT